MKNAIGILPRFRIALLLLLLFPALSAHAVDPSYELFVKKKVNDAFSIHEYENKPRKISSVRILNPVIDEDKYLADVYITTEKKVNFDVTSLNGFALKQEAGTARIGYQLYAETDLSQDPVHLHGTRTKFPVKSDNQIAEVAYGFSLKMRMDNDAVRNAVAGEYSDTLRLTMVVTE